MSGWGWAGSVQELIETDLQAILVALDADHRGLMVERPSTSQIDAWKDEYRVLKAAFEEVILAVPHANQWGVVLEYELPMEGGRRPDAVVLAGESIIVLEFKGGMTSPSLSARDQAAAYARDIGEYHEVSRGRSINPILVLVSSGHSNGLSDQVIVSSPQYLASQLEMLSTDGSIDLDAWLDSSYAPLPTLVDAARRIFAHKPLPHVHRARSARIPEAVEYLTQLAADAEQTGKRTLALVAGVPGAGEDPGRTQARVRTVS